MRFSEKMFSLRPCLSVLSLIRARVSIGSGAGATDADPPPGGGGGHGGEELLRDPEGGERWPETLA